MNRVFLSYATEDRTFAARLKQALDDQGADTFDPAFDLAPGVDVSNAVLKSLRRAELLVFIVPRFEGQGKSALVELGAARALGKRIVSVFPDRTRVANSDVAMALSEAHYLDGNRDLGDWAIEVLSATKAA